MKVGAVLRHIWEMNCIHSDFPDQQHLRLLYSVHTHTNVPADARKSTLTLPVCALVLLARHNGERAGRPVFAASADDDDDADDDADGAAVKSASPRRQVLSRSGSRLQLQMEKSNFGLSVFSCLPALHRHARSQFPAHDA